MNTMKTIVRSILLGIFGLVALSILLTVGAGATTTIAVYLWTIDGIDNLNDYHLVAMLGSAAAGELLWLLLLIYLLSNG